MKTVFTIAIASLILLSCSDEKKKPAQPVSQTTNIKAETFETFFEKFSTDSVFQKSRIHFPLATETYDIDAEKSIPSTIEAGKWEFFNIKEIRQDKKNIYNIRKEKDQYILNGQIEDTGVYVDYIFEQQEWRWVMVKIVDQST